MVTRPSVAIVALVCVGLLVQFVQYGVSASQAELDAQRAVSAGVRMAQHAMPRPGDDDVTLVAMRDVAPPSLDSRWLLRLKKVAWTYRPWTGARRESFTFTVCFSAGSLLADARRRAGGWRVELSPGIPGACARGDS